MTPKAHAALHAQLDTLPESLGEAGRALFDLLTLLDTVAKAEANGAKSDATLAAIAHLRGRLSAAQKQLSTPAVAQRAVSELASALGEALSACERALK